MPALDNQDLARPNPPPAGAVAVANEEAVRAWDTVLYERWKSNRKVFVGALSEVTEDVFELYPPPGHARCIDIGCGFGETTRRLAELVGPAGFALGTDSSPRFIEDARREAAEAGVENIEFEIADAQTAAWDPDYDYAFSRMGTQFFAAPVPAMQPVHWAMSARVSSDMSSSAITSDTAKRPPGLSTRAASFNTFCLSPDRSITQLEITTSTSLSASGISSM